MHKLLKAQGIFCKEYYLKENPDVYRSLFGRMPSLHFVMHGWKEGRNISSDYAEFARSETAPYSSLYSYIAEQISAPESNSSTNNSSLHHNHLPKVNSESVSAFSDKLQTESAKKLAVICHLYYLDMAEEIINRLKLYSKHIDIFFTVPRLGAAKIKSLIFNTFPHAKVVVVQDIGADILPFLRVLKTIETEKYDAILKLHTKKGYYKYRRYDEKLGACWFQLFLNNLLPLKESDMESLFSTISREDFMMGSAAGLIRNLSEFPVDGLNEILSEDFSNLDNQSQNNNQFVAGTMFWIKPSLAKNILERIDMTRFTKMSSLNNQYEHMLERIFGIAASSVNDITPFNFENISLHSHNASRAFSLEEILTNYKC